MSFRFFLPPNAVDSTASPPSQTVKYRAIGSDNAGFVNSYALGATPAIVSTIYGTLYRQDIAVRKTGHKQFDITVPYGTRKNETGEWTWDFDTTGGTVHISHARSEVARYPSTTAPDQKGAIGVNGDEVEGTDIIIPVLKVNVNFRHPLGVITIAQAKFLSNITGSVNSQPFLSFDPGEVLFLGARGSDGSTAESTVNYQFAMSSNATGLSIGDITGIAKKGHEYLWVRYEDAEATADSVVQPVRLAKFVYIDQVYPTTDFATALGFGG